MVGKSHIGGDYWRRTPTFRGFDSFLGYLYGAEDYYTHQLAGYFDLRNDTQPNCGPECSKNIGQAFNGTYSTYIFAEEVVRHIHAAASSESPTYIHFTPQSVHAPKQAPQQWVDPYVPRFGPSNPWRAVHAGALACLDAAVGNITEAISQVGLQEDTLIFITADNGGPLGATGDGTMASNYPFRGGKHSLYEGGVNAASFIWGPPWLSTHASSSATIVNESWGGLAHVTDVGLSLLEAAGIAPLPQNRSRHGVSFWGPLTQRAALSNRSSVIVNVDYTLPSQAAIVTESGWKLILGQAGDPSCDYWSTPVGEKGPPPPDAPPMANSTMPIPFDSSSSSSRSNMQQLWPLADMRPTLYNLTVDPRETTNVSASHPEVVTLLLAELERWGSSVAIPVVETDVVDPDSDPRKFNNSWTPWKGL